MFLISGFETGSLIKSNGNTLAGFLANFTLTLKKSLMDWKINFYDILFSINIQPKPTTNDEMFLSASLLFRAICLLLLAFTESMLISCNGVAIE